MTQIMYAKAMREVLEERKHQRVLEIMGMNLEMERLRHGQITHSPGADSGGAWHCSTDGEANTAIPEDTGEGAA